MAEITASAVKELRERSGAGMMDCKKALTETGGDIEAASDWLRSKGLAAAAKKSSRTAAEGLGGVAVNGTKGVAVEVNSETDFVAKNDQFQDFVRNATEAALALGSDDDEALKGAASPGGTYVREPSSSRPMPVPSLDSMPGAPCTCARVRLLTTRHPGRGPRWNGVRVCPAPPAA